MCRPPPAGPADARVSRGLAVGDLDNDGDPTPLLSNMDDSRRRCARTARTRSTGLLPPERARGQPPGDRREGDGHSWREGVDAGGAIGRKLPVAVGSRVQDGLGTRPDRRVEVRMPGGARWPWRDLAVDRLHALALERRTIGAGPPVMRVERARRPLAVAPDAPRLGRRRRPAARRGGPVYRTGAEAAPELATKPFLPKSSRGARRFATEPMPRPIESRLWAIFGETARGRRARPQGPRRPACARVAGEAASPPRIAPPSPHTRRP